MLYGRLTVWRLFCNFKNFSLFFEFYKLFLVNDVFNVYNVYHTTLSILCITFTVSNSFQNIKGNYELFTIRQTFFWTVFFVFTSCVSWLLYSLNNASTFWVITHFTHVFLQCGKFRLHARRMHHRVHSQSQQKICIEEISIFNIEITKFTESK